MYFLNKSGITPNKVRYITRSILKGLPLIKKSFNSDPIRIIIMVPGNIPS